MALAPLPLLLPPFPCSLLPSHQTPSFVVHCLGKNRVSFSICKLFTNYMHRCMGSYYILHGLECQVLGRLWTWEFRKVSISSSIDLSSCFWPYISTPRLFFMFLVVGGERAPTENLEIKHILLQKKNKPKTKENLPLSVLFLLVFLYFQIYLHESKKFLHLFL